MPFSAARPPPAGDGPCGYLLRDREKGVEIESGTGLAAWGASLPPKQTMGLDQYTLQAPPRLQLLKGSSPTRRPPTHTHTYTQKTPRLTSGRCARTWT